MINGFGVNKMDVKDEVKKIFGAKKERQKKFKNHASQSTVQVKRLDNYSDDLLKALEEYADEIDSAILPYNRKSTEKTMMVTGIRKSSQETTNRKTHMDNAAGIAVEIAKKLGLCVGATRVIARYHDIGHTFYGHPGERWLSNVKEDLGIGYYKHNALGPQELIYQRNIYDEIIKRIKEFNPDIKDKELSRIKKSLWLIFDGINAHNGEKTETEFKPDKAKTEARFKEELLNCFAIKDFDKTIVPATMEGCLIRLCDKISYIPYDMVDGIREGFIDKIDGEYIPTLVALGITEDEIKRCNAKRNYDLIIRKLQISLTKNVIRNSTSTAIRMSKDVSKHLHELRNINNKRIVKYTILAEDNEVYPMAIKELMNKFASLTLKSGVLEELEYGEIDLLDAKRLIEKYEGTPYEDFARYLADMSHEDYEFTQEMVYMALRHSIGREQEIARQIVLGKREFIEEPGYENRASRIREYIQFYQGEEISENYSQYDINDDIDRELSRQELKEAGQGLEHKIALEIGARYLSKLNDFEFFNLLKTTGLITEEQANSLSRTYREIGQDGLKTEVNMQKELQELIQVQQEDSERIGIDQTEHDER